MTQKKTHNTFFEKELSYRVLGAAMEVHSEQGNGFLEKVYEKALIVRLNELGIHVEIQKKLNVFYHDTNVGHYIADIVIENKIILELKTVRKIDENHNAQIINYLKASQIKIGYILNFANQKLEYKRFVF